MDKASVFGTEDWEFDPLRDQFSFFLFLKTQPDAPRRQLRPRKVWVHLADIRSIYDAQDVIRCLDGKTFVVFKQFQTVIAVRFGDRNYGYEVVRRRNR